VIPLQYGMFKEGNKTDDDEMKELTGETKMEDQEETGTQETKTI